MRTGVQQESTATLPYRGCRSLPCARICATAAAHDARPCARRIRSASRVSPDRTHWATAPRSTVALGRGVGMVVVPVSVTSMAGMPPSRTGVASGFLMTGHEIGAALGVAVLSAIARTAAQLPDPSGAADAFSRGFIGAAILAALIAIFAYFRMSSTRATSGAGHMHMH